MARASNTFSERGELGKRWWNWKHEAIRTVTEVSQGPRATAARRSCVEEQLAGVGSRACRGCASMCRLVPTPDAPDRDHPHRRQSTRLNSLVGPRAGSLPSNRVACCVDQPAGGWLRSTLTFRIKTHGFAVPFAHSRRRRRPLSSTRSRGGSAREEGAQQWKCARSRKKLRARRPAASHPQGHQPGADAG